DPAGAIRVNVMGTFYVMEAARLFEVPQLLFTSSIGVFGEGLEDEPEFRDNLLQRPISFYGLTKQFNEGTGLFFKKKYGLDYRSIRYGAIVGPGLREGGIVNYPTAMIEYAIKGERYTVDAEPTTKIAVIHIDDAVRGLIELGGQPIEKIQTVNYLLDGVKPTLSAEEMTGEVRAKFPGAQIDFGPSPFQEILDTIAKPIDDSPARAEWGWEPTYDYGRIIEDFIRKAN
ncbi:MAG: NAD-dependent epimerase/dehydratase family protein, partial [Proteobacteria bacterium]|nr:NAD-dependent epimerase/dehydratase family protein [Pseudomonadota bacterium]